MELIDLSNLKEKSFDYKKHVVNSSDINEYIDKFHNGNIKKGYGLGISWIDKYFVAKEYEFYAVVGKKGDGKTTIQQFWFLAWSIANDLKWAVCFKENMDWSVKVNMLNLLLGEKESVVKKNNPILYERASKWVDDHFIFLDVDSMHEAVETVRCLIDEGFNIHGLVLDPVNSFDSGFSESGNEFSDGKKAGKELLNFSKKTCSVHISQHPTMAGQRQEGDVSSNQAEGGWFFNKASFTYNINRTRGTSENRMQIENVRNKLTGGGETHPEQPLVVNWSPYKVEIVCGSNVIHDIISFLKKRHNPFNISDVFNSDKEQYNASIDEAFEI